MPLVTHPAAQESHDPSASTSTKPKKKAGKHSHAKAAIVSHVDVNSQLLDAVQQERPRVVRRLLDSKADPNTLNSRSETPLIMACRVQNEEARMIIVKLLLKKGADVNIQDRLGQTALMKAVVRSDTATVFALLDGHSDVSIQDCDGNNALCHAALYGNVEITQRIVNKFRVRKLDVDACNLRGLTPLLISCQEGHVECAQVLVHQGGASPKIRDLDNFMTAEEWMRASGVSCPSPDLAFLSPTTRKRNFYRKQRQLKGIKTLSDYPLPTNLHSDTTSSSPNVYHIHDVEDDGPGHKSTSVLPQLVTCSSPPQIHSFSLTSTSDSLTSSHSKSMFDFSGFKFEPPPLPPPPHKKIIVPIRRPSINPQVPFSMVKPDVYQSPYLTKRQGYINRDRKSNYYRRSSLEPLDFNAQERLSRLRAQEEQRERNATSTRHNSLPPLKKHSRSSS